MYSREYYDEKKAEFTSTLNKFTSGETSAQTMVRTALIEQETAEALSYSENEYLEEFTRIADEMEISSVDDFEKYLTTCLGGRLIDGVRALKCDNAAFFSSSKAVTLSNDKAPAISSAADTGDGNVLWREKHVKVNTWNRADGFTETEKVVCEPISEKQLQKMIKREKAFPKYKTVSVKDRRIPFYSIISVLLCMAVFILPVFLSIISNEIEVQNKEYDAYIKELNDEIKHLENEVALKKDMQLIDQLAREEYGMIDAELSQIKRVDIDEDIFTVEVNEPEESKSVWTILLSAIGIIRED